MMVPFGLSMRHAKSESISASSRVWLPLMLDDIKPAAGLRKRIQRGD